MMSEYKSNLRQFIADEMYQFLQNMSIFHLYSYNTNILRGLNFVNSSKMW